MVQPRWHVCRDQQHGAAWAQLEYGTNEATRVRAEVAADARSESEGQQHADAGLVCRWACRADELVGWETGGEQCRVADLLQGDCIQRELRASDEDAWKLAQEAEADVEGAHAQGRSRGRDGGRGKHRERRCGWSSERRRG